jgi:hypothetical protein
MANPPNGHTATPEGTLDAYGNQCAPEAVNGQTYRNSSADAGRQGDPRITVVDNTDYSHGHLEDDETSNAKPFGG